MSEPRTEAGRALLEHMTEDAAGFASMTSGRFHIKWVLDALAKEIPNIEAEARADTGERDPHEGAHLCDRLDSRNHPTYDSGRGLHEERRRRALEARADTGELARLDEDALNDLRSEARRLLYPFFEANRIDPAYANFLTRWLDSHAGAANALRSYLEARADTGELARLREAYDRGWADRGAVDMADALGPQRGRVARQAADKNRAALVQHTEEEA